MLTRTSLLICSSKLGVAHGVNVADEVITDFWVGGRYADQIEPSQRPPKNWSVTVDLTSEFPEACIENTVTYVNSPVWDGTPPSVEEVERCAVAIRDGWSGSDFQTATNGKGGAVMIHCAHGRGRSCMIACAGLVKSGRCKDWKDAFEAVKKGRKVCKLNKGMRNRLDEWTKKHGQ